MIKTLIISAMLFGSLVSHAGTVTARVIPKVTLETLDAKVDRLERMIEGLSKAMQYSNDQTYKRAQSYKSYNSCSSACDSIRDLEQRRKDKTDYFQLESTECYKKCDDNKPLDAAIGC